MITIIVLLILAGVTINLAVNNQGIFNKAKTATRAYKNASEGERTGLDEADKEIAKYMPKEGSEGESVTSPDAPTTTNYTGYYADVDDDGKVDGVIFIDLAFGASGNWNPGNNSWAASNNTGVYSYSAVTSGLRSYKISTKINSGKFGTKQVIAPNGTSETSGKPRFYVMALSDFDTNTYTWSDACSETKEIGSVKFRLPSKEEWSAFGGQLGITTSDYSSTYGLRLWYWSSTKGDSTLAWYADFQRGKMFSDTVSRLNYVRFCANF